MRDSVEQVMKPLIEMEDKDVARLFSELGDNPFLALLEEPTGSMLKSLLPPPFL